MKKYLVFCNGWHYPHGGWDDSVGSVDSIEEALAIINKEICGMESYY